LQHSHQIAQVRNPMLHIYTHRIKILPIHFFPALKVLEMKIHPKVSGLPYAHNCLNLLGFILIIFVTCAEPA
jgi:hypothetical protein